MLHFLLVCLLFAPTLAQGPVNRRLGTVTLGAGGVPPVGWICRRFDQTAGVNANKRPGIYVYYSGAAGPALPNGLPGPSPAGNLVYIGESAVNVYKRLYDHRRAGWCPAAGGAGPLAQACNYCWYQIGAQHDRRADPYMYEALLMAKYCSPGNAWDEGGMLVGENCAVLPATDVLQTFVDGIVTRLDNLNGRTDAAAGNVGGAGGLKRSLSLAIGNTTCIILQKKGPLDKIFANANYFTRSVEEDDGEGGQYQVIQIWDPKMKQAPDQTNIECVYVLNAGIISGISYCTAQLWNGKWLGTDSIEFVLANETIAPSFVTQASLDNLFQLALQVSTSYGDSWFRLVEHVLTQLNAANFKCKPR